uniref:FMN-binding domain-containing protein n=1 Tax=Prevotella sp. GTC17262 TaxID=3236797 RepID=A0AB33JHJ4_9BACT
MDMKKQKTTWITSAVAVIAVTVLVSAMPGSDIITQDKDTAIVNTEQLGKHVKGFRNATPVKIFIHKNKVVKIEALPNQESPKFFNRAKALLTSYTGKSVGKAAKMEVDGVSGATYSSNALKKNVQLGLNYYKAHR